MVILYVGRKVCMLIPNLELAGNWEAQFPSTNRGGNS